ncbi:MAG: hypothetical protein H8E25_16280 [Planctomycetes bacterium]|nr:hypothetical protein [Planctomycetota bacterium]
MFNFSSTKALPDRLLVYCSNRKSQKLELPHGTLNEVLDRAFAAHPESAQSLWTISSLLTTNLLKSVVLQDCKEIKNIYLRPAPQNDYALELQVDIDSATANDFATAAYQILLGKPAEVQAPPEFIDNQAVAETADVTVEAEFVTPQPRQAATGRKWQQHDGDIFGLAGEAHPDDQIDHGLEIRNEDLPWLNPGDSVISPRRGQCRIKKVDDDERQVLVRDERKNMLMISFHELLAEFEFDDDK